MANQESELLNLLLLKDNLLTYDPYDIWKDGIGLKVKALFNKNRKLALAPAGVLIIFDFFINNRFRFFYKMQEFPIARGLAAMTLLNLYKKSSNIGALEKAKAHINWLLENSSEGYSGYCWGANVKWASKNGLYDKNMPFVTHTPYPLEALVHYQHLTGAPELSGVIGSVYDFLDKDLHKMIDTEDTLALSYAPIAEPRPVINANAYAIYCFCLLLEYRKEQAVEIRQNVLRIYNFLLEHQQEDGSWWYYGDNKEEGNFIDCFHTCFVLKNLIKASRLYQFPESFENLIKKGYKYLLEHFWDEKHRLFKRFTKNDKVSLVKFDLYDNAEMLNLFLLMGDKQRFNQLNENIKKRFIVGQDIYSVIDLFNQRKNKNMLRWAVLPYLYSISNDFN